MRRGDREDAGRQAPPASLGNDVGDSFAQLRLAPVAGQRRGVLDQLFTPLMLTPTVATMALAFGIPLLISLYISVHGLTSGSGGVTGRYVSVQNYADLLTDTSFLTSIALTCIYTLLSVGAEIAAGLAVALLLNLDLPWISFFRTALIVPMMMTPVVAAIAWKLLLDPRYGVVNALLGVDVIWLGDPITALITVTLVDVWQNTPYVALLLLAALRTVPRELLEAASIDGANSRQTIVRVVLPILQPTIVIAVLLRTVFEFRAFDNVYILTGGGPANGTMLISLYAYMTSFISFDLGLSAAASWIMLAVSLLMCLGFVFAMPNGRAR